MDLLFGSGFLIGLIFGVKLTIGWQLLLFFCFNIYILYIDDSLLNKINIFKKLNELVFIIFCSGFFLGLFAGDTSALLKYVLGY